MIDVAVKTDASPLAAAVEIHQPIDALVLATPAGAVPMAAEKGASK